MIEYNYTNEQLRTLIDSVPMVLTIKYHNNTVSSVWNLNGPSYKQEQLIGLEYNPNDCVLMVPSFTYGESK